MQELHRTNTMQLIIMSRRTWYVFFACYGCYGCAVLKVALVVVAIAMVILLRIATTTTTLFMRPEVSRSNLKKNPKIIVAGTLLQHVSTS